MIYPNEVMVPGKTLPKRATLGELARHGEELDVVDATTTRWLVLDFSPSCDLLAVYHGRIGGEFLTFSTTVTRAEAGRIDFSSCDHEEY